MAISEISLQHLQVSFGEKRVLTGVDLDVVPG